jgi:hypothetical protein
MRKGKKPTLAFPLADLLPPPSLACPRPSSIPLPRPTRPAPLPPHSPPRLARASPGLRRAPPSRTSSHRAAQPSRRARPAHRAAQLPRVWRPSASSPPPLGPWTVSAASGGPAPSRAQRQRTPGAHSCAPEARARVGNAQLSTANQVPLHFGPTCHLFQPPPPFSQQCTRLSLLEPPKGPAPSAQSCPSPSAGAPFLFLPGRAGSTASRCPSAACSHGCQPAAVAARGSPMQRPGAASSAAACSAARPAA